MLLSRAIDHEVRQGGPDSLSMAEVSVLGQVDRGAKLPSAIARALQLDPGRVTRITDQLVSLGYITREIDPDDRRRCLLRLTDTGRTRIALARQNIASAINRLLSSLDPEERAALIGALEHVRTLLEK